ncbi:MAG: glycosyltransferase family 61 protein [Thalassobaculaceae bacterium]|nr:glycosyltransferase family 61 protein [Thalassobaculaceae bacterium]
MPFSTYTPSVLPDRDGVLRLMRAGGYAAALAALREWGSEARDHAYWLLRGTCAWHARMSEAEDCLRSAILMRVDDPRGYSFLLRLLTDQWQVDRADRLAHAYCYLDPLAEEAWIVRRLVAHQFGNREAARSALRRAAILDPASVRPVAVMAAGQDGLDLESWIRVARRNVVLTPDEGSAHRYLGEALRQSGDLEHASQAFSTAFAGSGRGRMPKEVPLDRLAAEPGVFVETVRVADSHQSLTLVRFEAAVVDMECGLVMTRTGLHAAAAYCHMEFPDKYTAAWSDEARNLLEPTDADDVAFSDAVLLPGYLDNYGHWLVDSLPSLLALGSTAGISVSRALTPRLPAFKARSAAVVADALGLSAEVTAAPLGRFVAARNVVVAVLPNMAARMRIIRRLAPVATGARRLFVHRRSANHRRIRNVEEVKALLGRHGFETVYPEEMTFDAQIELFAQAEAVIGAQGAAMTNLLFSASSTRAMMFYGGQFMPFYHALAKATSIDIESVPAQVCPDPGHMSPEHRDLVVNLEDLSARLATLGT